MTLSILTSGLVITATVPAGTTPEQQRLIAAAIDRVACSEATRKDLARRGVSPQAAAVTGVAGLCGFGNTVAGASVRVSFARV